MNDLQQLNAAIAEMRAARQREERLTLLFLGSSVSAAAAVILIAIGLLFASWPASLSPPDAGPDSRRYLEARR